MDATPDIIPARRCTRGCPRQGRQHRRRVPGGRRPADPRDARRGPLMRERLAALYHEGRLTDTGLDNAVTRGWLTQADADASRDEAT